MKGQLALIVTIILATVVTFIGIYNEARTSWFTLWLILAAIQVVLTIRLIREAK